ncbi:UNVERIFIED_CONTAM: hypothetical protein K2H54_058607 [Gekko kuhli]
MAGPSLLVSSSSNNICGSLPSSGWYGSSPEGPDTPLEVSTPISSSFAVDGLSGGGSSGGGNGLSSSFPGGRLGGGNGWSGSGSRLGRGVWARLLGRDNSSSVGGSGSAETPPHPFNQLGDSVPPGVPLQQTIWELSFANPTNVNGGHAVKSQGTTLETYPNMSFTYILFLVLPQAFMCRILA